MFSFQLRSLMVRTVTSIEFLHCLSVEGTGGGGYDLREKGVDRRDDHIRRSDDYTI